MSIYIISKLIPQKNETQQNDMKGSSVRGGKRQLDTRQQLQHQPERRNNEQLSDAALNGDHLVQNLAAQRAAGGAGGCRAVEGEKQRVEEEKDSLE